MAAAAPGEGQLVILSPAVLQTQSDVHVCVSVQTFVGVYAHV